MLKRSEARMGHTKRISHSRLASASANMPYKIEKLFAEDVQVRQQWISTIEE